MITGPVGHGLYVILTRDLTCDLTTLSLNLHHLRYKLFFIPSYRCYNLISLVPTQPSISTSSSWSKSVIRCMWAKKVVRFDPRLTRKDYLQTDAFPNLVVVKQEEYLHALQGKPLEEVLRVKWWGDSWLDAARPNS